jgi:hypothetical protein
MTGDLGKLLEALDEMEKKIDDINLLNAAKMAGAGLELMVVNQKGLITICRELINRVKAGA